MSTSRIAAPTPKLHQLRHAAAHSALVAPCHAVRRSAPLAFYAHAFYESPRAGGWAGCRQHRRRGAPQAGSNAQSPRQRRQENLRRDGESDLWPGKFQAPSIPNVRRLGKCTPVRKSTVTCRPRSHTPRQHSDMCRRTRGCVCLRRHQHAWWRAQHVRHMQCGGLATGRQTERAWCQPQSAEHFFCGCVGRAWDLLLADIVRAAHGQCQWQSQWRRARDCASTPSRPRAAHRRFLPRVRRWSSRL